MYRIQFFIALLLLLNPLSACKGQGNGNGDPIIPDPGPGEDTSQVALYATSSDKSLLFSKVPLNFNKQNYQASNTIYLNSAEKFQEMDGFGAAITGSACYNLLKMSEEDRAALLKEVFHPVEGMGYSYVRISIGCSDFSLDEYTCCDTKGIENFAIHPYDKRDLFPILKQILAINPHLKIMASPWTCPKWMKVNNLTELKPYDSWTSGQLNPRYYNDYAKYFVLYVKEMEANGFSLESITIQNEPLNRGNSASLYMGWEEQRDFIRDHLGPAFEAAGIKTRIVVFDHNFNYDNIASQRKYPLNIYADPDAARYIDGSAWHAYGGSVSELDAIHAGYPEKNIYFTEMSIGTWSAATKEECFSNDLMWNMREVCLGSINRWCRAVIMWNLLLDDKHGPYRPGGCGTCYGCIDIQSSNYRTLTRNSHYYTMAHLSKVVLPGAFRIKSNGFTAAGLYTSAFINKDGSLALVALNDSGTPIGITVNDGTHSFAWSIPPRTVASFRW